MANNSKKTQNVKKEKEDNKKVVKKDNKKNSLKEKEKNVSLVEEKNVSLSEEKILDEKMKKMKKEKREEKLNESLKKLDDNRKGIILFIVGFLLATLIFRCIFWPDRIATLKDGTQPVANLGDDVITADDLYGDMKELYSVNYLLKRVDRMILTDKYDVNEELQNEINSTAEYYYTIYEQNGYSKEQFLSEYGYANENQFLEDLKLDNLKNKYYEEYALSLVTDKEVQKYYDDEVFGDVDSKHILVAIDDEDGLNDEQAKELANEIINKLNNGTSWDDIISEYKDQITDEELGYNAFNASLESAYLKEMKDLEVGSYSKSPVLTSYGYHIVYKIDQKDKPSLDDVYDDVKEILADDKKENDTNLYYKALIHMRDEAKLEFVDTKFKEEYDAFVSNYK